MTQSRPLGLPHIRKTSRSDECRSARSKTHGAVLSEAGLAGTFIAPDDRHASGERASFDPYDGRRKDWQTGDLLVRQNALEHVVATSFESCDVDSSAAVSASLYTTRKEGYTVFLLWLLAILTLIFFGLGFTIKWLFALAIVFALLWVISMFVSGLGGRSRGAWW